MTSEEIRAITNPSSMTNDILSTIAFAGLISITWVLWRLIGIVRNHEERITRVEDAKWEDRNP